MTDEVHNQSMKPTDLMIGDWVRIKGRPEHERVRKIGMDNDQKWYIYLASIEHLFRVYEFDPIPLTPEILEKNGWKETAYWHEYQDGGNIIQCRLPDMRGVINEIEINHFKCEYVHQYQHLLRLCGLDELADNFKV